jgi:hypothetical protein
MWLLGEEEVVAPRILVAKPLMEDIILGLIPDSAPLV